MTRMKYLDNEASVRMVQVNHTRWEVQTTSGFVLVGDLHLSDSRQAEDYVKNYLSSYQAWGYEMVPLVLSKEET